MMKLVAILSTAPKILSWLVLAYSVGAAAAWTPYPSKPELTMTPGGLCDSPDEHRYPEQIPYCERNVSSARKWEIIDRYDREFGYQIREMGRDQFKIDHLVPLCMGGNNKDENLWPQHADVFEQTDPWEQHLCVQLAAGDITQREAIEQIYKVKLSVEFAP